MLLYNFIWFQLKEAGKVIWGFGLLCGLDKWKLHWFYPINGFKPTVSCSTSYVLFCYLIALESPPPWKKTFVSHFPFPIFHFPWPPPLEYTLSKHTHPLFPIQTLPITNLPSTFRIFFPPDYPHAKERAKQNKLKNREKNDFN